MYKTKKLKVISKVYIILLLITILVFNNYQYSYGYTYPDVEWIPNVYLSVEYSGPNLESKFNSSRTLYQVVSNENNYTATGEAPISSGGISNTACTGIFKSLLITKTENNIKKWEAYFVITQKVYIIDDTYGIIGSKPFKYYLDFSCSSNKGKAIRYNLTIYDSSSNVLYEIVDKTKSELSSTIYLEPTKVNESDFITGHVGVRKHNTEDITLDNLTSVWNLYKKGSNQPISLYEKSPIGKYGKTYAYGASGSPTTLIYTSKDGYCNIYDLPKGDYVLEEITGSNSDEMLYKFDFTIGEYGLCYINGQLSSSVKEVNMQSKTKEEEKKKEEERKKQEEEKKKEEERKKKEEEERRRQEEQRKEEDKTNRNNSDDTLKEQNVNNNENDVLNPEDVSDKTEKNLEEKVVKKTIDINSKVGIQGSNIENKQDISEEVIIYENEKDGNIIGKIKMFLNNIFSMNKRKDNDVRNITNSNIESNMNDKKEINIIALEEESESGGYSFVNRIINNEMISKFFPVIIMAFIIVIPLLIGSKKHRKK